MKLLTKLEKKTEVWFLIIVSFSFFILRLPSLFEPLWYGDEGIYQVIGMAINQGRLLYRDIWDNKPPLLYILYTILQSNQPVIRFACLIAGLISVILFYFLTKKLFQQKNIYYTATSIFALLLGTPILEGNIANAENFMMPFILGAALLILNKESFGKQLKNYKSNFPQFVIDNCSFVILLFSGLLLGLAFLFKVVAIFDLAAFTLFLIFIQITNITIKQIKKEIFKLLPLYLGFLLPFITTLIFFLKQHALSEFIHSAFLSNVGYVNYGNQFIIPQGLLIFKLLLLGVFCFAVFLKRNRLSTTTLFILLWLAFSIFSALFSQRPYTHYLLVMLTSFCLFIGLLWQKTKSQLLFVGVFFLLAMYFLTNFSFYTKNITYYQNFISFMTNKKDITSYRAFFDAATPRDYILADFLKAHAEKNDQIFLWGNNAQLYMLANKLPPGKYIVAYHITASQQTKDETQQALIKTHPRFIIDMPNAGSIPFRLSGYSQRIMIDNAVIYERSL